MALNVMGLFDTRMDAEAAARELRDAGFNSRDISFLSHEARADVATERTSDSEAAEGAGAGAAGGAILGGLTGVLVGLGLLAIPGVGPVLAAGPLAAAIGTTGAAVGAGLVGAGLGAAAGGLLGALVGMGVPEEDANVYAEGVRRGGTLLAVQASDEQEANRAAAIMNRHNAVDINRRAQEYRQAGWTHFEPTARTYDVTETSSRPAATTTTAATSRVADIDRAGEIRVPVVEEHLSIGKRAIEGGGVRVYRHVEERPVTEQVTLRDETVHVERRPVDRAASDADFAAVREGTLEVREHHEEVVVDKQTRIVEEVVVGKDVREHTETVQDTVRRTDVHVDEMPGQTRTSGYTTTAATSASDVAGARDVDVTTGRSDEGAIERGLSQAGNAAERATGLDLDRDRDVGQRDPRNNY